MPFVLLNMSESELNAVDPVINKIFAALKQWWKNRSVKDYNFSAVLDITMEQCENFKKCLVSLDGWSFEYDATGKVCHKVAVNVSVLAGLIFYADNICIIPYAYNKFVKELRLSVASQPVVSDIALTPTPSQTDKKDSAAVQPIPIGGIAGVSSTPAASIILKPTHTP